MTPRAAMLYRIARELGLPRPWPRCDADALLVAATVELDAPVHRLVQRCRLGLVLDPDGYTTAAEQAGIVTWWPTLNGYDEGALCGRLDWIGHRPRRVGFRGPDREPVVLVAVHHLLSAAGEHVPEELSAESSRLLLSGWAGVIPGPWPPLDGREEDISIRGWTGRITQGRPPT